MSSLTNAAAQDALDHLTGTTAMTFPAQLYLGVFTVNPSETGGGTEVTGGGYIRQAIDFTGATLADPSVCDNSNNVEFSAGMINATVTGIALFDASTTGNMVWWMDIVDKVVGVTDVLRFPVGSVDLSMD